MEESIDTSPQVEPQQNQETGYSPGKQLTVGISVTLFLIITGIFVYFFTTSHSTNHSATTKSVLSDSTVGITPIPTLAPNSQNNAETTNSTSPTNDQTTPAQTATKACTKNGPAQKWEYLTPYVVKDGDTLQSIATTQLSDVNRINEILQLNGQGPYVVGSTIYLPPSSIPKSSGNIKKVYGLIVKKDSSYWQLSYSSDPKGLGILIPSFWFDGVSNSNSFIIGSCIKVLFDDGNKVYSVSLQ